MVSSATTPPPGHTAHNMELVAYHDLNQRPAFKLAMQAVRGRWYLYTGCFGRSGWNILDVTDPTRPELAAQIDGPPNTGTGNIQVAEGLMVTALEPAFWGSTEGAEEGVRLWDVSEDPLRPVPLGAFRTQGRGTHRNYYDGGNYLHLSAGFAGYRGNQYACLDIGDRQRPREVSRWALPEMAGPPTDWVDAFCWLHGPPYVEDGLAYCPWGQGGLVILDVSDPRKPQLVSRLKFEGIGSRITVHTVRPLKRRKLLVLNDEQISEPEGPWGTVPTLGFAGLADISDIDHPRLISLFPQPTPPEGVQSFHDLGGRFGPHNQHLPQHQECLEDRDDLIYLTYFNAGLRVYDIENPHHPREVAYFLPGKPLKQLSPFPRALVPHTEDVLVDRRGFIYISDRNHGIHVLRLKPPDT